MNDVPPKFGVMMFFFVMAMKYAHFGLIEGDKTGFSRDSLWGWRHDEI